MKDELKNFGDFQSWYEVHIAKIMDKISEKALENEPCLLSENECLLLSHFQCDIEDLLNK
jgi:hypothetical protein